MQCIAVAAYNLSLNPVKRSEQWLLMWHYRKIVLLLLLLLLLLELWLGWYWKYQWAWIFVTFRQPDQVPYPPLRLWLSQSQFDTWMYSSLSVVWPLCQAVPPVIRLPKSGARSQDEIRFINSVTWQVPLKLALVLHAQSCILDYVFKSSTCGRKTD